MRNNSFIKWALALAMVTLLFTSAYPAFATSYTIKGTVTDVSGNGVPGAKVILEQDGLQIGDTATTANDGSYMMVMDSLPWGEYQMFGEKDGQKNSRVFTVTGSYSNYTVDPIMLRNYLVSGVPATPTPAPTVTPTPTPEVTAAPDNATATPVATATVEATPTAAPSSTPAPTPGFTFVLVPAALALCFVALRKIN